MKVSATVNQLVIVVISSRQAEGLMQSLVERDFYFTKIDNTGMLFEDETICMMIGLNSARTSSLFGLIAETCKPREDYVPVQFNPPIGFPPLSMIETRVSGALVYSMEVERFVQF
jgi:uncharacterized protein YaaQ